MKTNFTQLIPAFCARRLQPERKATLLFLLLLLFQVAWAQSPAINTNNPGCATVQRGFELTLNGSGFDTRTDGNGATVVVTGTSFPGEIEFTPKFRTATQVKVDIPGNNVVLANPGSLTIAARQNGIVSNTVQMSVYPTSTNITGPTSVCVSSAGNFSVPTIADAASYSWSVVSGSATITAGVNTPNAQVSFGSNNGTVRIRVIITPSCGAQIISDVHDITVNALPTVTLTPFNDICTNAGVLTLTGGAPAGGIYTVNGITATRTDSDGTTTSTFDPATAGVGVHEVIYYYTQNGCTGSAKQTITVLQAPAVSLAPFASVCSNAPTFSLTGGSPANGTYMVNGVAATSFDPAAIGVGTHTIAYTVTQNGCTSTASQEITVAEPPTVSLDPFADICSNTGAFTLGGGQPNGGTYSVNGTIASSFDPATFGPGNHTITYTITDNGCASTATQTITVLQAPMVSLTPFDNVCSNAPAFNLIGGLPTGGSYTVNGVAATSFNPATIGVGTHTIAYTVTQNGCTSTASQEITVLPTPNATITVPNTGTQDCPGGSITLRVSASAGANYQWFRDNNPIPNTNSTTYSAIQTGNYSVQVTNNGCSATSAPVAVTILDQASIIAEGPQVNICAPQTSVVLHAITGNYTYQWFMGDPNDPATAVLLTDQNHDSLVVTQTGSYYVVLGTQFTGCPVVTSTPTRVDIATAINDNTITASNASVCSGNIITLTGSAPTGGNNSFSYQWQISVNGGPFTNINTNGTSQNYTYTSASVAQINTISFRRVVTSGACNNTSTSITITVNPEIVNNIINNTAPRNICPNGSTLIEASLPTGGSGTYDYQWQSSDDNVNFTIITGAVSQDYSFNAGSFIGTRYFQRVVTSGGCASVSGVVAVTVNSPITGNTISASNTSTCAGNPITFTGAVPTGGTGSFTYQWQVSVNGGQTYNNIQGANGQDYILNSAVSGVRYYRRVVNSGVCFNESSPVIIRATSPISGNLISPTNRSICTGSAQVFQGGTPIGGSGSYLYKWQISDDGIAFTDLNTFSAANKDYIFSPGDFVGVKFFRRVVSSGSCSSSVSNLSQITVQRTTTYTLILTVDPQAFPVCGQALYTARIIQNVEQVIYPDFPQYEQVTWTGGTDVTSQFTLEWYKNDTDLLTATGNQVSLPGPQSRDYYTVRADHNLTPPTCFLYNNRPDLVPASFGIHELFSNRIYRGSPEGYAVNITTNVQPSNAVCVGAPVTFTAAPNSPDYFNPQYQWYVNGQSIGITSETFTTSTLNNGDVITVTFTSDENLCDPIISDPVTMLVVSPQTMIGGGTFCGTPNSVSIGLQGSQVGVLYQLMRGADKVLFPIQGNGGAISFGSHNSSAYPAGTYSIQPLVPTAPGSTTLIPVCSSFGSLTVEYTTPRTHTVDIIPPTELISGQSATFTAESTIEDLSPVYRWYVFDFDNPNAGFVLQTQATTKTFVLNPVPEGDIEIRVEVVAPNGVCVDDADGIASDATGQINPLPVELLYLKAEKKDNNVVELEWATAMEQNSEGFEVQVSQDAKNFRTLAFVASKVGGNTNQKQVYTFHDKENGKYGTRYYRLMQRDMNGNTEYFGPKAVLIGEATESLSVYPNPFGREVNLEFNAEEVGTMHVIVTNAIGAKVLERTYTIQKGNNRQMLQFNHELPLGMYTITTRLNGKTRYIKLLKQ